MKIWLGTYIVVLSNNFPYVNTTEILFPTSYTITSSFWYAFVYFIKYFYKKSNIYFYCGFIKNIKTGNGYNKALKPKYNMYIPTYTRVWRMYSRSKTTLECISSRFSFEWSFMELKIIVWVGDRIRFDRMILYKP